MKKYIRVILLLVIMAMPLSVSAKDEAGSADDIGDVTNFQYEIREKDTQKPIYGIRVVILDTDGTIKDDWITGSVPYMVENIKFNTQYKVEITPPEDTYASSYNAWIYVNKAAIEEGYFVPGQMLFYNISGGFTITSEAYDSHNGERVTDGVVFGLYKDGVKILEGSPEKESGRYEGKVKFKVGVKGFYELRVDKCPNGYVSVTPQVVEVKNLPPNTDSDFYAKVYIDRVIGKFRIRLIDKDTKKPLSGYFIMYDKDGKELERIRIEQGRVYFDTMSHEINTRNEDGSLGDLNKFILIQTGSSDVSYLYDKNARVIDLSKDDNSELEFGSLVKNITIENWKEKGSDTDVDDKVDKPGSNIGSGSSNKDLNDALKDGVKEAGGVKTGDAVKSQVILLLLLLLALSSVVVSKYVRKVVD